MNANERLQDLEIKHAAYLERFTQNEINLIKMTIQDAVLKLSDDLPPKPERLTAKQLQALVKKSESIVGSAVKDIEKIIEGSIEAQIKIDTDKAVLHVSDQLPDGVAGKLKIASPSQVRELIDYTPASKGSLMSDLVSRWESDTVERFSAAIRLGVLEGDTLNDLTRRIRGEVVERKTSKKPGEYIGGVLESTSKGAETLARTAVAHVNNRAREAFYAENEDIIKGYQYVATLDTATCPVCGSLDGQVFGIDEPKPSVPQHYNCLPGDTLVSSISRILAVSERDYNGKMVRITTLSGKTIEATPNHPILTDSGFVFAKDIHAGHNVISHSGIDGVPGSEKNKKDIIPTIEEAARSFVESGSVRSKKVPLTSHDFHGDAIDNEIAVISADLNLGIKGNISGLKYFGKPCFMFRNANMLGRIPKLCSFDYFIFRSFFSAHSIMSRFCKRLSFLWRCLAHPFKLLFGLVPLMNSMLVKHHIDISPTTAKRFGNAAGTCPGIVDAHDGIYARPDPCPAFDNGNVVLVKESENTIRGYSELASDIIARHSSRIQLDNVVRVVEYDFSGHVYNLQTESGWYIANGIITHNCRCLYIPILKSWKEMGLEGEETPPGMRSSLDGAVPSTMTYEQWLSKQSKQTQDDIMGAERAKMFRSGIALTDMVDRGKVLTLKELGEKIDE